MQKFDLSKVEIVDPVGDKLVIDGLHRQIGDTLFYDNKHNLAIYELGRKIANKEPFDISENELKELTKYVEEWQLAFHVKIPLLAYLKGLANSTPVAQPEPVEQPVQVVQPAPTPTN